jgi:glutathione S-transferase
MRQAQIPFEEIKLRFDSFETGSQFKQGIQAVNPVGKVPALVDGDLVVWDTLAIAEYLAEYAATRFPGKNLWPADAKARARARSVCAEMHSGFGALRQHCGMNVEARLPDVGAIVWRDQPEVRANVARLEQMWTTLLDEHDGPMLFGDFSIADAYFAPVCMRLQTYALPVCAAVAAYAERVRSLPGVRAWVDDALAEKDFVGFEEPYRARR